MHGKTQHANWRNIADYRRRSATLRVIFRAFLHLYGTRRRAQETEGLPYRYLLRKAH
ncbi:hypothetical protein KCP69_04500 [Salmonella enterica subsp. enterica]|nr:hypothetical protein KCP69_04500 [Salmonella enterica subsp. enterica]